VISPGVYVAPGAVVCDSIIMTDTVIETGAQVSRAIVDKRVRVESEARLGWGDDNTPNLRWPERLNTGLTIVGKGAVVPQGTTVGRNVVIFPRVTAAVYPGKDVPSGETVD
jgi:glucose-1-phosphate adenylyltransferase